MTDHKGSHSILRIKEHLSTNWSEEFEGLAVTYTPTGETLLTGFIPDQSALHGLLARIRDLNLTLISLYPVGIDELFGNDIEIPESRTHMEE